jgi:hypothetical protein
MCWDLAAPSAYGLSDQLLGKDGKAKADAQVADAKQTLDKTLFGQSDFQALKTVDASGDATRRELEALRQRLS